MKYPLFFFAGVVVIVLDFVLIFTNFNTAGYELSAVLASEKIDECFDQSMATWFTEFNLNQDKGIGMIEADQIASAKALNNFDNCN